MDVTTVALAVDSSQVNSAAAALKEMSAAGNTAVSSTAKVTQAALEQNKVLAGTVSTVGKATTAMKGLATETAATGKATQPLNEAGVALDKTTTKARGTKLALLELADVAEQAGTRTERALSKAAKAPKPIALGSLETATTTAGASSFVDPARVTSSLGASTFRGINDLTTSLGAAETAAAGATRQVNALSAAAALVGPLQGATTTLGVDSSQITRAAAAVDSLTSEVAQLGATQSRLSSVVKGGVLDAGVTQPAIRAEAAITDLSRATTSFGASSFASLDNATTSLGATEAAAKSATREVNTLRNALSLSGDLRGATTSPGATGPAPVRAAPVASPVPAAAVAQTNAFATAAGKANKQVQDLGKSAKDTAFKNQQLAFQMQDFFVQVQAGGSPLTALIQQGSQLAGTFGGVGNAFRAVLATLTPVRLAIGGIVGVLGALGVAFFQGRNQSQAFSDAMIQTGNFAGKTEGQFNSLIGTVSKLTGETVGNVREFGQALLSTGEIGPQVFNVATEAAVGYSKATGKTADEVAKDFAQMSRAPSKFAAEANRAFNFLTLSQYAAIKAFEDNGRAADAQGIIYDALNQRFAKVQQNLGTLERTLLAGKNVWSSFWNSVLDIGRQETIDEKIAKTQAKIATLQPQQVQENAGGAAFVGPRNPKRATAVQQSLEALQAEQSQNRRDQFRQSEVETAEALRSEQEKRRIAAFEAVQSYKEQAKGIALVNREIEKARQNFRDLEGTAKAVPKEEQERLIADIRKRNSPAAGPKDREPEQIRRAKLDADISGFQAALQKERDALAFHNQFVRGEYQAGNLSLQQFYEDRRASIERGVAAEITELQDEKDRLAKELSNPKLTDPSEREKLNGRIAEATAEQERARLRASNDVALTNQEQAASFKALSDQVIAYRANLLQLQGDEVGAARLRAQQAIEQASVLSRQTAERGTGAFSREDRGQQGGVDVAALQRTLQSNIDLQKARQESNRLTEQLQIEEERIALQQQSGSISEVAALERVGAARRAAIDELEKQVAAQEEVAKTRPQDFELQISTQRARLELDKLKESLDPLAEKYRNLFRDAGTDAFADILNGEKGPKAALTGFAKSISTEINRQTAGAISDSIFGKGGPLGGIFGSKDAKRGEVKVGPLETTAVTQSLATLQNQGIDPTTGALTRLTQAADAAAVAVGRPAGAASLPGAVPAIVVPSADVVLPTTGDLARADRAAEAGTADATQSAQALSSSLVDTRTTAQQFAGVLGPAVGILASLGGAGSSAAAALSLLPAIIAAASASSTASSASSSGGSIFSSIGSLFGGSGSTPTTGDFARMDRAGSSGEGAGFFATAASFFSSFFHTGGIVGDKKDMRAVDPGVFAGASKYHSGGIVGGEALASLKANEVPAILLGGPKGVREEVLTANDPRHKDNLSPILLKTIQDAQGNPASVLSIIASGGKGGDGGEGGSAISTLIHREQQTRELSPLTRFLMGSPETVQGLISELSQEADFEGVGALRSLKPRGAREIGGPVSPHSLYRVNEKGPELLQVAGKSYLMTGGERGTVEPQAQKQGQPVNVTINNQFAPGTDRQTIAQGSVQMGAIVRREVARGTVG